MYKCPNCGATQENAGACAQCGTETVAEGSQESVAPEASTEATM